MQTTARFVTLATFVMTTIAAAPNALAFPVGTPGDGAALRTAPEARDLLATDVDFTGIVALSNCSGALVRFKTSLPTDKAMVLSNGHCLGTGMPDPDEVVTNVATTRSFRLLTRNGRGNLGTVRAEKLLYATMLKTDMALYRLNASFADIESTTTATALTMSDHRPASGSQIRIVSGYWRRTYGCELDGFVHELLEGGYSTTDSIRYGRTGCDVIGGTSGSPIIDAATKEVVGVNNTGNEDGERCTDGNPCEIDAAGTVTVDHGRSYGQQTYWIYSCLDGTTIDLDKPGCMLPKPAATTRHARPAQRAVSHAEGP